MEDRVVHHMLQLLRDINTLENLQHLHLVIRGQRSRLKASTLARVLGVAQKNLKSLEVTHVYITSGRTMNAHINNNTANNNIDGISEWAESMKSHRSLETVALVDCHPYNPDQVSLLPVIRGVADNQSTLKSLTFDSTVLRGATEYDAAEAFGALGRSATLKTLKIRNCTTFGFGDKIVLPLLQQLPSNKALKELSLLDVNPKAGRLASGTSKALGDMLMSSNTALESLMVSLAPEVLAPAIEALRVNASLKRLDILLAQQPQQQSSLHAAMIQNLCQVLRDDNLILEQCRLSGIAPPSSLVDTIEYFLTLNRLGRHYLLTNHGVTPEDWINTIGSSHGRTDVVLYFMLKNPTLVNQAVYSNTGSISTTMGVAFDKERNLSTQQPPEYRALMT